MKDNLRKLEETTVQIPGSLLLPCWDCRTYMQTAPMHLHYSINNKAISYSHEQN